MRQSLVNAAHYFFDLSTIEHKPRAQFSFETFAKMSVCFGVFAGP